MSKFLGSFLGEQWAIIGMILVAAFAACIIFWNQEAPRREEPPQKQEKLSP